MTTTAKSSIYNDIAQRTDGGIYIGVVGPVRTGKSTLIKRFMEALVIPNLQNDARRQRAVDELPQSAAGRTIMTTEPKFVPEEPVEVSLEDGVRFSVRMIDCVGYIVPSALGYIEEEAPRMVMTPWFEEEVPFNMAAELGTQKVITEHSTIGLVVTCDGSISDIPREEYEACEQRVIHELKSIQKPFAIVLNCSDPGTEEAESLCAELSERYQAPVLPVNCLTLDEEDIRRILTQVLYAFPIREINLEMPEWITGLAKGHWLRDSVFTAIRSAAEQISAVQDAKQLCTALCQCEQIVQAEIQDLDLGTGIVTLHAELEPGLFYQILGEATGLKLSGEGDLMPILLELCAIRRAYEKIQPALAEVEATGYGIVMPDLDELSLEEPQMIKQGGKYGVRLKASAPSIHMMRANINTTVSPIVGSEKQSEDLVRYLLEEFEENPAKIWESNIFGKSLHSLVNEGLHNKLFHMPSDARLKLQETLERVINEGCSGLICLIL